MSQRDDFVYLEHMLECIACIEEYTGGDAKNFFESRLIQDAVVRNLQILAESSQRLSESLKADHPAIPWRDLSGFRNILVHDYLGLDLSVIWSVIEMDLPALKITLEKMVSQQNSD